MSDRVLLIPEVVVPERRKGRHVRHDPRSRAYRVGKTAPPTTARHERRIPILDQGDLGSCTGNATVGALGSEPFYSSLSPVQRASLDEQLAIGIYGGATKRDDFSGSYPPEDTGSDGLSVAQEAQARGLISGYQHILSIGEAFAAIIEAPFIVGTVWMSGMETPDSHGVVLPTGKALGGHEWLIREYDATTDLWTADNSWSEGWGIDGSFKLSTKTLTWLLGQQGDATTFVPITSPAPVPVPEPTPVPSPAPAPVEPVLSDLEELVALLPEADLLAWIKRPRGWKASTRAAASMQDWLTELAKVI